MKRLVAIGISLVVGAAVVGATATAAVSTPQPAPASALFASVPEGGFPDAFPFGQCTWWAAYNRHVEWGGNAGDWILNAEAAGTPTASQPSVGAIAVYGPSSGYSEFGHVAVVTAVSARDYTVSEMNYLGWGRVDTRTIAWPDPRALGFIPLRVGG